MEDAKGEKNAAAKWWQNPTAVGVLVAVIAAVPPLTAGVQSWINARNQLDLARAKQAHEIRQKYLDRILSDVQSRSVLQFLVDVEDDKKLRDWADKQLKETERRIARTKPGAYEDAISTVAKLASQHEPIDKNSAAFKNFWSLYEEGLLPYESPQVESLMVNIGNQLNALAASGAPPNSDLQGLSYQLARTMKQELAADEKSPVRAEK